MGIEIGGILLATVLFLIAGVAVKSTCGGTGGGTNGGSFEATPGLVADDASERRTAQTTGRGTALCVRSCWGGAVGQ